MTRFLHLFALLPAACAACAWAQPSYKLVDTIAIEGPARWDYLTLDGAAHRLYVAHGERVDVIDTQTDRQVGAIEGTPGVHGVAIAHELGLGFISAGRDNSVTVFDLDTLARRAKIAVGRNPDAIIYEPSSSRVIVFNGKSRDATIIDAKRGEVAGTVALGGKPEFAQRDDAGMIYFNVQNTAEVAVLDPVKMAVVRRTGIAPCRDPTGLAIDARRRLYSVCENRLMVVTTTVGTIVAQLPIGTGPDGVAFLDGSAISANGRDGTLTVVRAEDNGSFKVIDTVPTQAGARTIAADPATHRLYLPTSDLKEVSGSRRPQGVDGTFRVLVFEAVQ